MNKGLVVGRVVGADGDYVPGAMVSLNKVAFDSEILLYDEKNQPWRHITGQADKYGTFRIKFRFDGGEITELLQAPFMYLHAWTEKNWTSGGIQSSQVTTRGNTQIRSFPIKNVLEMTQAGISTFKARDDLQEFAKEFVNFGIGLVSTESWLLVGGAYIYLKNF